MTDWLMVIITTIYVIATIFICVYNGKSAKAAEKQTEEMQKQFLLTNRPILSVELVYIKRAFLALRFTNNGNRTAFNTSIVIDQDFIDNVPEEGFRKVLENNNNKRQNIGVGQSYDLYFATNRYLHEENKMSVKGKMIYNGCSDTVYSEDFVIDIENYAQFFNVNSDIEDLIKELKNQTKAIGKISEKISRNLDEE